MRHIAIALLTLVSSSAFACPNLVGKYMISSGSTLEVKQGTDEGVTIYNFNTKNEVCAKCEYNEILRADGQTTRREFAGGIRVELRNISCAGDTLRVRTHVDNFSNGRVVTQYDENYDYSLSSDGGLVEQEIKDGKVYRTTLHYRLAR